MLTLTYRSTHFFLLEAAGGYLLLDAGWPGSLPELSSRLKAYRLDGRQIKYVLPTHFHPDHAGLVQEVKQAWGARLIVHERQVPHIPQLAVLMEKKGGYVPVQVEPNDILLTDDNRAQLNAIGLRGIVIPTPGHSDDSVSLVLDTGEAFIGDLPPPHYLEEPVANTVRTSWLALLDHGARTVYPSHTPPAPIETVRRYLDAA